MTRSILALVLSSFVIACGPTLVFPGGELHGTPATTPDDWSFTEEISTIQIETRPGDPYSVNIWAVGIDERLYIHAGANRATWVEHLEVDPAVRARIEDRIYGLEAVRVESQAEFDVFADAYDAKYGVRPRNENVDEVYLFALVAR